MLTHRTQVTARRGIRTGIAIILLALMLFPVYWMLNTSLQPSGNTLSATFFPAHPSLDGYRTAINDQGQNLVTRLRPWSLNAVRYPSRLGWVGKNVADRVLPLGCNDVFSIQ